MSLAADHLLAHVTPRYPNSWWRSMFARPRRDTIWQLGARVGETGALGGGLLWTPGTQPRMHPTSRHSLVFASWSESGAPCVSLAFQGKLPSLLASSWR